MDMLDQFVFIATDDDGITNMLNAEQRTAICRAASY